MKLGRESAYFIYWAEKLYDWEFVDSSVRRERAHAFHLQLHEIVVLFVRWRADEDFDALPLWQKEGALQVKPPFLTESLVS